MGYLISILLEIGVLLELTYVLIFMEMYFQLVSHYFGKQFWRFEIEFLFFKKVPQLNYEAQKSKPNLDSDSK